MLPQSTPQTNEQIPYLLERIAHLRKVSPNNQRVLIAVAGSPGSGKSTLCARLLQRVYHDGLHDVVVVPMVSYSLRSKTIENTD